VTLPLILLSKIEDIIVLLSNLVCVGGWADDDNDGKRGKEQRKEVVVQRSTLKRVLVKAKDQSLDVIVFSAGSQQ